MFINGSAHDCVGPPLCFYSNGGMYMYVYTLHTSAYIVYTACF